MSGLARYQLGERLHEGPRHDVVCATAPDGEPVVLKILKELHPSPDRVARFRHEYETLAAVQSDHVVAARAFETDQRRWALVQADFGGRALADQLDDPGLGLAGRLDIAIAIAAGIADLHASSLIHKDINPSNIVRNPHTGEVRLIDFGIATPLALENPAFSNRNRLEGTLRYISPEQTGRVTAGVDSRSDLYSLGATLYELFVGRLPFESDDALELVHAHIARVPRPPQEARPSVPGQLSDLVMRLLRKGVDARYQSARGVLADLRRCREGLASDGTIAAFPLAEQDLSDRLRIPARLYGREAEASRLVDALSETAGSGAPSAVLITGVAGMGKSALVHALYGPLTERRGYYIQGKFEQFRRTPFSALVAAFRSLVTELLGESEERLARMRNDLAAALGPNGRVITDVLPQVELITGPQPAVEELGASETLNRFDGVFRSFVRVFARPEHPVALFLDDLQWADAASLNLMRGLILDQDQSLLILGAYRHNEVDATHPLTATLKALADEGVSPPRLELGPLGEDDVHQLLTETLGCRPQESEPLAALVARNTGGNPLFVREFVTTLWRDGLLRFDRQQARWTWDLSEIAAKGFTQSVLELMATRLGRLAPETQAALHVAACAGSTFDLPTVARLRGESVAHTWSLLLPAVQDGVLVATSELDVLLSDAASPLQQCSFFHDRIQQAAYEALAEPDRARIHLELGRALLRADDAAGDTLFEAVFQLNQGRALVEDPQERLRLARLNLEAGLRAAASAAHDAAAGYFDAGDALLPDGSWTDHYDLTMGLRCGSGEAHHVLADHDLTAQRLDDCIAHANTELERADLYVLLVRLHTAATRYPESLAAARTGLAMTGFTLVEDGYMEAMLASFGELQEQLAGRSAAEFLRRPQMTDPVAVAQCRLLSWSMAAAFYTDPLLYSVISFEAMKILIEHGNPPDALAIYAQCGHLLGAMFGDPPGGYAFTKLSRELSAQTGCMSDMAESCFLSANFSLAWVRPLHEARAVGEQGIQAGLQSGDLRFTNYIMVYLGLNDLHLGRPLDEVLNETSGHLTFCQRQKDDIAMDAIQSVRHALNNLAGNTSGPDDFSCDGIEEAAFVERLHTNQSMMVVCYLRTFQCAARAIYRNHAGALEASKAAHKLIATIPGNVCVGRVAFHTGLALAGRITELEGSACEELLEQLDGVVAQLAGYEEHCEANWGHPHALVAAERARVRGDGPAAIAGYERAIALADQHGWPADQAVACELAGRYWRGAGRDELAGTYLAQARYGFEQWGARRKVAMLDAEFPDLGRSTRPDRSTSTLGSVSVTSTAASEVALDLAAVMKASQAISGELDLPRLLGRLMEGVLEAAGAQRGVLVVVEAGELAVRAAAALEPGPDGEQALHARVDLNRSLGGYDDVSAAMVQYVARTADTVVLEDASEEGRYTRDPHVLRTRARSVLCLPLRNQGEVVGVLYLENASALGAFTTDRMEVVQLLASQFSISFENARLYQEMEDKVARRTEQLAHKNVELEHTLGDLRVAQDRLVASNAFIRKTFGRYVSDDVVQHLLESPEALELGGERRPITVLASDVRGFTVLAERLEPEAVITLLNQYFEAMFTVIRRHGGTINAILGDGLFVFFGAPIAVEDAPRRAVACALEMMLALDELKAGGSGELRMLEMGIGVHSGAAVVGNIGSQDRTKYSAIGLDVNLAARIEGCTVGGQILVSDATAQALGPDVVLAGSMEFSTKGVQKPLTLHEVEGLGGSTPLTYRRLRAVLAPLEEVIDLRFSVVSGGVVAPTIHRGTLTRLSADEAELVTEAPLAPLTNLKIQFFERGGDRVPGDVYGKVLSATDVGTRLGFTAVPPPVRSYLEARG